MAVNWRRSGPWVGVAGMLVALWFYGFMALVAPWWVVPIMVALWIPMFLVVLKSFNRRPWVAFAMPLFALVVWFVTLVAGARWWGWQA